MQDQANGNGSFQKGGGLLEQLNLRGHWHSRSHGGLPRHGGVMPGAAEPAGCEPRRGAAAAATGPPRADDGAAAGDTRRSRAAAARCGPGPGRGRERGPGSSPCDGRGGQVSPANPFLLGVSIPCPISGGTSGRALLTLSLSFPAHEMGFGTAATSKDLVVNIQELGAPGPLLNVM